MNPGKIIDPYPITSNLRLGRDYRPPKLETRFHFPTEGGGFERAAIRCVGVGSCRRHTTEAGVMCPSYMATMEEKHSTRGRSHLLFEMLHGGPIEDGWKSREVEERSTSALRAKAASTIAPSMSTWRPTRRSFARITMREGSGREPPIQWE
jgi:hypothetical protein